MRVAFVSRDCRKVAASLCRSAGEEKARDVALRSHVSFSALGTSTLLVLRFRRIWICGALAVIAAWPASALDPGRRLTQYLQRIWQARQGLPQSSISSILQTRDGYMWLGTAEGLVRFDGVRFTSPEDLDGLALPKISVRQLTEDSRGALWIATSDAGLFRIENGTIARFSRRDGLPSDLVGCVFPGQHGNLWACTEAGIVRIRDGKVQVYKYPAGLTRNKVAAAAERSDGTIWLGGDGPDLSVWDGASFTAFTLHSLPPFARVQTMLADATGDGLWIGTTAGLIRLQNGREQRFTKTDGLANDSVLSLAKGKNRAIWIGTDGGFSRWRDGDIESFLPKNGLSQSTVASLYEDREGSLWVGTKRGLNQFVDRRTIPFTTSEGLPSDDTGPVFQDAHGIIWVGTLGAGLARFDGRRSSVLTKQEGLSSNSVVALAGDAKGTLWVGTDAGLDQIRDGRITGIFKGSIRSLYQDVEGTLWIGALRGPAVLREGRIVRLNSADAVVSFVEADGKILAAVEGHGIRVFDERTLGVLASETLAIRDATAFYRDAEGRVWIGGTGSGLHVLDGGKQTDFSMQDGLFDDEIYGITADTQDRLWLASSKGIFSVYRRDLLQFAAGKVGHVDSTPFSPLDGLQTVECKPGVQPAVWRMRDGRLSFSTIRGLIAIDPEQTQLKMDPPPVVIESVAIDGRSQSVAKMRDLAPGDENLELRYTALSLRAPQRITFRYKLEGFDRDWVIAGTRRQAFYTNLRPGNYQFRVTACNADGTCNESGTSLAFALPARFYQQTWFYLLSAVLLVLLARLAYVFRIQHMERQFGAILAERTRIARELHDTLLQGFSGVTMEMQALAGRLPSGPREALREIIHDAANCLTEARRSVSELRRNRGPSPGLTAQLSESARQLTAPGVARLKLAVETVPSGLPAYVEYNLLRIAQDAIINAVKHSGAKCIEVTLQLPPGVLRIVVQDNGVGFVQGDPATDHFGLIGIKERAKEIGADLRVVSEPRMGTSVVVEFPIRKMAEGVLRGNVRESVKAEL
jgi:ligand-binding sensor domain-containing protein/signal transduction histidine kinase